MNSGYKSFDGYMCCDFFFVDYGLFTYWDLLMNRNFYFDKVRHIKFFFYDFMTPKLIKNVFSSRSFMVWGFMAIYDPSHWF